MHSKNTYTYEKVYVYMPVVLSSPLKIYPPGKTIDSDSLIIKMKVIF